MRHRKVHGITGAPERNTASRVNNNMRYIEYTAHMLQMPKAMIQKVYVHLDPRNTLISDIS